MTQEIKPKPMTKIGFIQSLGWPRSLGIKWIGQTGYVKLDENRHAVINISERSKGSGYPTAGTYTSIEVWIESKTNGKIGSELFPFNDHMEIVYNAANPNAKHVGGLHVVSHVGWKWYINQPKSTKPLMQAISDYIGLWK